MQTPEPGKSTDETPDFDALDYPKEQDDDTQEDSPPVEEPTVEVSPPSDDDEEEFEVEVKVIEPSEEEKGERHKQQLDEVIQEAGTYSIKADIAQDQYMQVGILVDMWADLIEGYGMQAHEFYEIFKNHVDSRNLNARSYFDNLSSTGFLSPPMRRMYFCKRDPVTITVYFATQGNDLYVSWRAFVLAEIAEWKVKLLVVASVVFSMVVIQLSKFFSYGSRSFLSEFAISFGAVAVFFLGVGGWLCFQSFTKLDGDYLGYFREPLHELHADDVLSLSTAVHKSIIHAADKLGIDTTKLEEREPFYKTRKKRRF